MIGVTRHAVSGHFRINRRTAGARMLQFFQHNHAGTLAHHKSVAVFVIGTAGAFGLVVESCRQRFGRRKPGNSQLAHRRLGTARDHHIRIAVFDDARAVADGMRSGRARGDHRVVRALVTVANLNLS